MHKYTDKFIYRTSKYHSTVRSISIFRVTIGSKLDRRRQTLWSKLLFNKLVKLKYKNRTKAAYYVNLPRRYLT
jgi:hypothetical protein